MKQQGKSPLKELNEIEARNPSEIEFKTMVINMCKELRGRVDDLIKNLKRSIKKGHRNKQTKKVRMKNTISEMKNTLEGIQHQVR